VHVLVFYLLLNRLHYYKIYYYVIFSKAVTSHWYNSISELQCMKNISYFTHTCNEISLNQVYLDVLYWPLILSTQLQVI